MRTESTPADAGFKAAGRAIRGPLTAIVRVPGEPNDNELDVDTTLRRARQTRIPFPVGELEMGPPQTFPAGVRRHRPVAVDNRPICEYEDPDSGARCDRDLTDADPRGWKHTPPLGGPAPREPKVRYRRRSYL
ncbi:MAG: hypothetical protein M3406_09070 [Chloroflexota bacterium]|nr:hypothetical protein [Chloroflexota bacterium]